MTEYSVLLQVPYKVLSGAILIAGLDGSVRKVPPDLDAKALARLELKRLGVRQPSGKTEPLARSRYRHRTVRAASTHIRPPSLQARPGLSIFGGILGPQFGHQITQSLGRLWLAELFPDAPVLFIAASHGFSALPGPFLEMIRAAGVTNPIDLATHSALCDDLVVGADLCNLERQPSVDPMFLAWLNRHRESVPADAGLKVYVSRSGLVLGSGQFLQETVLEQALALAGYTIFHPEREPITTQIDVYRRASKVILADGSAAHVWSLFANPQASAAVVLRRPVQRHFVDWFNATRPVPHFLDYGLADLRKSGQGPGRSVAVLDMNAVWDHLRALGFHDSAAPIATARPQMDAWLQRIDGWRGRLPVPDVALDDRSIAILASRTRAFLRTANRS